MNNYVSSRCSVVMQIRLAKLEVTQKCNSRCLSCSTWAVQQTTLAQDELTGQELTFEEHLKIIDDLKDMGCKDVEIHGGEPTLYRHLPELVAYCTSKGISTFFSTNGLSMTQELAHKLVEAGLNRINFSLDGPREAHNILRGREDAFDKQMAAIEMIRKADTENKILKNINTCVSAYNMERLDEVVDIAAANGVNMIQYTTPSIIDDQIVAETNAVFGEKVATNRILAEKQVLARDAELIERKRKEIKEKARNLGIKLLRTRFFTLPGDEVTKAKRRETGPCWDIYAACTIDAFGNVVPCELLRYKIGNVREMSLKDIYEKGRFAQFTEAYTANIDNLTICEYCVDCL